MMFHKLSIGVSVIYLTLLIGACSKNEYTPQDVRSIGIVKEKESELLMATKKAATQLGFDKTIEMAPFSKDGIERYSILLKNGRSFVNLKNIYSEKCIDVSIYLEEPSLEGIERIYKALEREVKKRIPEYRDRESIYTASCE